MEDEKRGRREKREDENEKKKEEEEIRRTVVPKRTRSPSELRARLRNIMAQRPGTPLARHPAEAHRSVPDLRALAAASLPNPPRPPPPAHLLLPGAGPSYYRGQDLRAINAALATPRPAQPATRAVSRLRRPSAAAEAAVLAEIARDRAVGENCWDEDDDGSRTMTQSDYDGSVKGEEGSEADGDEESRGGHVDRELLGKS